MTPQWVTQSTISLLAFLSRSCPMIGLVPFASLAKRILNPMMTNV